jgi:hypothetical protein
MRPHGTEWRRHADSEGKYSGFPGRAGLSPELHRTVAATALDPPMLIPKAKAPRAAGPVAVKKRSYVDAEVRCRRAIPSAARPIRNRLAVIGSGVLPTFDDHSSKPALCP